MSARVRAGFGPSLLQCLVISGLETGEKVVVLEGKVLDQGNRHNSFFGIDLAIGGRRAVPAELANRRGSRELAEVGGYLDSKAKSFRSRRGLIVREGDQVIGGH